IITGDGACRWTSHATSDQNIGATTTVHNIGATTIAMPDLTTGVLLTGVLPTTGTETRKTLSAALTACGRPRAAGRTGSMSCPRSSILLPSTFPASSVFWEDLAQKSARKMGLQQRPQVFASFLTARPLRHRGIGFLHRWH